MKTVDVLGVPVACVHTESILQRVEHWISQPERRTLFYVNAHCLNIASSDAHYRAILKSGDMVYPDGISVVWAGRLLSGAQMQKSTGADWVKQFCHLAVAHQWRIYILAGRPGIAHTARDTLLVRHPTLRIVGAYDGFFVEKSQHDILADIARTTPGVLFVGMGTPLQEKWIAAYRPYLQARVCWAIGAMFDYVAGIEPRVPIWMNDMALEWLWRFMVDPVGKWRRYLIGNPLFLYRIWQQKRSLRSRRTS